MPAIALRVSTGTSASDLKVHAVNYDEEPFEIKTAAFEGRLVVRIKGFHGAAPKGKEPLRTTQSTYFETFPKITWSIQLQGRFLKEFSGDDVVFGNIFDAPIRDYLPYGTSAALKAVSWIDPSLEQDIYADKPWAWSPLIATMQLVRLSKSEGKLPAWSSKLPDEDVSAYVPEGAPVHDSGARRKYFSKADHRKEVTLGPDTIVDADFSNGFLSFETLSLKLGAGLEFPLVNYWNGSPVTFVCRTRDGSEEFFRIEFTIVDKLIIEEKRASGIDVSHATEAYDKDLDPKEAAQAQVDKDSLGID